MGSRSMVGTLILVSNQGLGVLMFMCAGIERIGQLVLVEDLIE
jgi:hypothetical protein